MQENNEITEIKELLVGFIQEQKLFNEKIDKKIDKVQYFLEETIAENTKMFFEEQIEMKNYIRELEGQIKTIKSQMVDLSSRVNLLFKA
ncbi:MAG: hypothetical protein WC850_02655 [Candidatus Gracilibacteria bacterium]